MYNITHVTCFLPCTSRHTQSDHSHYILSVNYDVPFFRTDRVISEEMGSGVLWFEWT